MSNDLEKHAISRRTFVRQTGVLAGGALLANSTSQAASAEPTPTGPDELPHRILGKTGLSVSVLGLGTAPCGHSGTVSAKQVGQCVNAALDSGINYVDASPRYRNAEEGIGKVLGRHRKNVILTTKIWADDVDVAEKSLSESLKRLKTDYVDIIYFHSIGNRDMDRAMDDDGVFTWLVKQKKAGRARFVGASSHSGTDRFGPLCESGDLDVAMMILNFVDKYVYEAQQRALPIARKHNVGVVAMKVFGGMKGGFPAYNGPPGPALLDQYRELAIRYTMGLPGVAMLNIGVHSPDQVPQNVAVVKHYQPLTEQERAELETLARQMAPQWGPRFGPLVV